MQIIGFSGSGKTTLVCKLIQWLKERGITVGTIKHDAHSFEMDYPGKDTWKHREAGAKVVAISSSVRTAILEERQRTLEELIERISDVDLILVEGYKFEAYPKYLIVRHEEDLAVLDQASGIVGVITRFSYIHPNIATFSADDIDQIGQHLMNTVMEGNGTETRQSRKDGEAKK
jgi:molybdopterin-guanine dinucleotide biosynthesis protein B